MQNFSTIGSRLLAIVAGVVLLSGTLIILFEDVIMKGASLGLKHWITLVVLAGTILTGHLVEIARASRRWLSAIGLLAVFLCGTGLVIYQSVGRQAETVIQTSAQIEADAGRRVVISKDRLKSSAMLEKAQDALYSQCVTGKASRGTCDGIRATISVYEAAIRGHDADLSTLGAPKVAAPEAEQFAEIAAALFGADKTKVKAGAVLVVPFLITLFLEFGTIVCFSYGFHRSQKLPMPARSLPPSIDIAATDVSGGNGPASKQEALDDLKVLLRRGTKIASQDELANRWSVTKGCVSKWVTEWEADGLITRTRDGKQKVLMAA